VNTTKVQQRCELKYNRKGGVLAFTCNKNQNYKQKPKAKEIKGCNKLQKRSFVNALKA
jgi:hypothetical protein